jgi:plastocyanin
VPKALIAIVVLALAAGGCSKKSSEEKGKSSSKPPVTLSGIVNNQGAKDLSSKGSSIDVEVEQDDFYFAPTFIKAAPGATVKIEVANEGKTQHTFTIDALGVDQALNPDEKKDVTITLPTAGVVNFYCRFHRPRGMQGAFYFG